MASFARQKSSVRTGSLRTFVKDEAGLSTTEYIIILTLIAVGAIAAWSGFGASVRAKVHRAAHEVASLEGVASGAGGGGGGSFAGEWSSGEHSSGSSVSGSGGSWAAGRSGSGGGGSSGSVASGSAPSGSGGAAAHAGGATGGAAGVATAGAANAAARSRSNASVSGASDIDRANEQLDQQERQALKERRMIAFGIALLCLLSLIGLAVYNAIRAKKIREEALKQKELAARQAAYAVVGISTATAPPPAVGAGGGGGSKSESLADITIPPPPKV
jgi:Flp pilus assembly pilin Flp